MGLLKTIEQIDGIITKYHRIEAINFTINEKIFVVVFSYIDEETRRKEKENENIYKKSRTYSLDYKENMPIAEIYNYLKTLPEFENSIDV